MADGPSNSAGNERAFASRAEIDALSEMITATIALAERTRSTAAAALLERARETLDDRARAMRTQDGDVRRAGLRPS